MAMRSVMKHQFSQVPQARIERSSFDRSHGYKTTFNAGYLIPVFVDEVLPGDTFNLTMTSFARLSTPIHPVMDNMFCDAFFFFVPNRLLWANWQRFMGEQPNPGDSTSFLVPQVEVGVFGNAAKTYLSGSIYDYMGLPVANNAFYRHNSLHLRAYNLIWNEWFRDQNLQNRAVQNTGDGPDLISDYVLRRRGKRHDYFTSALPWPTKGPLGVNVAISPNIPVIGIGVGSAAGAATTVSYIETDKGTISSTPAWTGAAIALRAESNTTPAVNTNTPLVYADTTTATIASLRNAFQVQKIYERDARGGTRYTELILAHFGVSSPDARLQRPEYLGGGSTPINIHPIPQTSNTGAAGTPQGNLAATGTFSHRAAGFTKSFTEHGVLLGLVSVRADITYQNNLLNMWSRQTRFDFYWPALAHVGEQGVKNKELYVSNNLTQNDSLFGYQERYADYRYKPSLITGLFRSITSGDPTNPATLDSWHLSQNFGSTPTLNTTWIEDNPPISRVVAVTTEPHFLFDAYFRLHCARPMPVYGTPGLVDHF